MHIYVDATTDLAQKRIISCFPTFGVLHKVDSKGERRSFLNSQQHLFAIARLRSVSLVI